MGLGDWAERQWRKTERAPGEKAGAIIGGFFGGPLGYSIGKAAGAGWDGSGGGPTGISATPEQTAAFEREKSLRGEAIRQARGMGGAAARGAAQQGALAYGGVSGAPAGGGRLAGLRDVGQGAEAARQQAAMEATIFEQEASPEAARQKKMAWLTQQMESLRAAGRLTPEAVRSLAPMAGGDPQLIAFLDSQAAQAPGESSLRGDVEGVFKYLTG